MRTFTRHREREAEGLQGGREQTGRDQGGLGGDSGQAGGECLTGGDWSYHGGRAADRDGGVTVNEDVDRHRHGR